MFWGVSLLQECWLSGQGIAFSDPGCSGTAYLYPYTWGTGTGGDKMVHICQLNGNWVAFLASPATAQTFSVSSQVDWNGQGFSCNSFAPTDVTAVPVTSTVPLNTIGVPPFTLQ